MGYILIVVGIAAIVAGIVMVTRKNKSEVVYAAEPAPSSVVSASSSAESAASSAGPQPVAVKSEPAPVDTKQVDVRKEKGNQFEDVVVNLLADWKFKLLDSTQDAKSSAGVVAESCKNPDMHVAQKRGKSEIDYYLECKYKSQWKNGVAEFEDWQLDRYRKFQRENRRKVIIALGVGGTPSKPATLRLVPLDSIKGNTIKEVHTQFAVSPTSDALYNYMNSYFSDVFETSKERKKK